MKKMWKSMIVCGVCLALVTMPFQTAKADDWSDCSSAALGAAEGCLVDAVGVVLAAACACEFGSGGVATLGCAGASGAGCTLAVAGCASVALVAWDWCWAKKDFGYNDQKSFEKFVVNGSDFSLKL